MLTSNRFRIINTIIFHALTANLFNVSNAEVTGSAPGLLQLVRTLQQTAGCRKEYVNTSSIQKLKSLLCS